MLRKGVSHRNQRRERDRVRQQRTGRKRPLLFESLEDRRLLAIFNPYADVDWVEFDQHKGNLHTHTTQSDGRASPAAMIDTYRGIGYSVLALTDHDTRTTAAPTWPWTDYDRDPAELGMVAIQGNEISGPNHIGSYFNDYGDASQTSESAALAEIRARGGLAVMFHPGRYSRSVDWYVDLYRNNEHLIGMEVYNQGDRYPGDRDLWDQLLTRLMPGKPVWGFSNDDAHNATLHPGRNWQTFILAELTEEAVRNAMVSGQFYFSYAPNGHLSDGGDPAPVINSIAVDDEASTITIVASGYTNISWISAGVEIANGVTTLDVSTHEGYVRAELIGPNGKTYTQPFFVGAQILRPWQNPVYRWDINDDGMITPLDVLIAITEINANGARQLPVPVQPPQVPPPYYDVSGDNALTALDVLLVTNYINAHGSGPVPKLSSAPLSSPVAGLTYGERPEAETGRTRTPGSLPDGDLLIPPKSGAALIAHRPRPVVGVTFTQLDAEQDERLSRLSDRWEPLEDVLLLLDQRMPDKLLDDVLELRHALFAPMPADGRLLHCPGGRATSG